MKTSTFQLNFHLNMFLVVLFNSLRPNDAYMHQYSNHQWFRQRLGAWSAPSHYLNQCWNIVNPNLKNKLQWNLKRNSYIFIQENAFENLVCEMAAILSRPQCIKASWHLFKWCLDTKKATNPCSMHGLNQRWQRILTCYNTEPQWFKSLWLKDAIYGIKDVGNVGFKNGLFFYSTKALA